MNKKEFNFEPLVVGMTYNYPQLCSALGEAKVAGKQKQLQLKRWMTKYVLIPTNKKYYLQEIRDIDVPKPMTADEQRTYQKYIHYILLCYLKIQSYLPFNANSNFTTCFISKKEIQQITGFTNELFLLEEQDKNEREEFINSYPVISQEILDDAYQYGKTTIRNCLRSLKQQSKINYIEETQICFTNESRFWKTATKANMELVRRLREETLKEYGLKNEFQVKMLNKEEKEKFYESLYERYKLNGINAVRPVICIWLGKDAVDEHMQELANDLLNSAEQVERCVRKLNERTVNLLTRKTKEGIESKNETQDMFERINYRSLLYKWSKIFSELGTHQYCIQETREYLYDELMDTLYGETRENGIEKLIHIPINSIDTDDRLGYVSDKNKLINSKLVKQIQKGYIEADSENSLYSGEKEEKSDSNTSTSDDWGI